ncbi:MAG: chemotaxis protein CheW [Spirochaetia bacterium]|nr:chemotaxis protein CheW [Spirochaetia bacterium]
MKQAIKTEERTGRTDQQFLTFYLAGQLFAIDISNVKEIIAYGGLSFIPLAPKYVKGVLNLRGHSVPVLDLSFRFKKLQSEITKLTCIVIIEVQKKGQTLDVGLMVESVNEVISISNENIDPSPDFGTDVHIDFIDGIGKVEGNFIVIINAQSILDVKDFSALEDVIKTGKPSGPGMGSQESQTTEFMRNFLGDINVKEGSIAAKAKAAAMAAAEAAAKAAAVAAAAERYEEAYSPEDIENVKAEAEAALAYAATAANEALIKAKEKQAESTAALSNIPASEEEVVFEDESVSDELVFEDDSASEDEPTENVETNSGSEEAETVAEPVEKTSE